jgi:hypothetical protein
MNDEGTRSRILFFALDSAQTKINSKNGTGAIFLAVKIGDFLKITLTDMNFLTLWWVIEDGPLYSNVLLMYIPNFYWLRTYF